MNFAEVAYRLMKGTTVNVRAYRIGSHRCIKVSSIDTCGSIATYRTVSFIDRKH